MTELLSEEFWADLADPRPMARRPAMASELFDDLLPGRETAFSRARRATIAAEATAAARAQSSAAAAAAGIADAAPADAAARPGGAVPTGAAAASELPLSAGSLSGPVSLLVSAVGALRAQVPAELPGPQALAETGVLLAQVEQLRVVLLDRLADVDLRRLSVLDGAATASSWVGAQHTSIDRSEVALAKRLSRTPQVQAALHDGTVTIGAARRVAAAMATARRHLDRSDGLIDGVDGEAVITNVLVDGVRQLVCEAHAGLESDDPRLGALIAQLAAIAARPTSQADRLEVGMLVLAEQLEPHALTPALGRLLDAVLPLQLHARSTDSHDRRGFGMHRNSDGAGWTITDGELDDECGELLFTVLTAELAVDPDNPADTADYAALREQGWTDGDPLPAEQHGGCADGPRSARQRRHDALAHALRRLLDTGTSRRGKEVPHLHVTVDRATLDDAPGALPARAASGASLPVSLVRSWACDSALTRYVLSLGRKVLETSHTARTLTGTERRAKHLETGGQCQAAGCRRGPGDRLIPHHATPWARRRRTSLDDTVLFCEQTHHQLHHGATIRLKDGRWLDRDGWTDGRPG